jgi:ATP-binding cassette subfamily F protein 3
VHVYPGNYEDYLWRKEGGSDALAAATAAAEIVAAPIAAALNGASTNGTDKDKGRRVNPIKLKQMQERLAAVEAEMPKLEASIAEAEQALGNFVSAEETARISRDLDALRHHQTSLTNEWEDLMLQLEEG